MMENRRERMENITLRGNVLKGKWKKRKIKQWKLGGNTKMINVKRTNFEMSNEIDVSRLR